MLHSGICRRNNRRFRIKIFGGQGIFNRKTDSRNNFGTRNKFGFRNNSKFNKIKISVILIILLVFKLCICDYITVYAKTDDTSNVTDSVKKVIDTLDLSDLEKFLSDIDLLKNESVVSKLLSLITGDAEEDYSDILSYITSNIYSEISSIIPSVAIVLTLVIFLAVIEAVKSDKTKESVANVCTIIGNVAVAGVIIVIFMREFYESKQVVEKMSEQIQIVFPIILTMMTASGATAGVSIFKPSVSFLCNAVSVVYVKLLFPIILFILCFSALNSFSSIIKTDKMSDFLKSAFKWIVGLSSVFFCFFVTAQGIASSTYDTVSLRALKYAVGNSVPLINGLLSSGFDVVVASCLLIKNALGTLSMIAIIYVVAMPLIKLVILSLALRLLSGVTQSVASDSTIKLISATADATTYLATALAVTAIVYIITILITMCSMGASI